MKVLHLLQSNSFSGAENVVCQIISMMKDEGIEFAYASPDGQIREALLERNITFFTMQNNCFREFRRVIKEFSPDIIHAHDMGASFFASMVCGKIPMISHIHNNNFDSRGVSPKAVAYMLAAKKANHIFYVSDSAFKGYCFHELFRKKSSVLYNIIDIDALYKKAKDDNSSYSYDFVYVGRLSYPKNPQRLMNVCSKVCEILPEVKIAVVGTGELENETKELCRKLNISDNIEFLGYRNNPFKILKDSKAMIMTSRWEGTPMCALEALSLGVPIVSTPTDGLCTIVQNKKNGFLSEDDDVLAQKLVQIITDSNLHKNMHEHAMATAKRLMDIDSYKKKILEIYYQNEMR